MYVKRQAVYSKKKKKKKSKFTSNFSGLIMSRQTHLQWQNPEHTANVLPAGSRNCAADPATPPVRSQRHRRVLRQDSIAHKEFWTSEKNPQGGRRLKTSSPRPVQ